ncbi:MAG: EI24 domain-containing protein, partial [Leptospirales bacterium]|nr:EI24 domain-containing protein [Leptospirales bacterium]
MNENTMPENLSKGSFVGAFLSVFSSLSLVKQYKLYVYFIIPFLLNIVILSSIFYFSFTTFKPLIESLITGSGIIFDMLRFIINPLLLIIQAIITIFVYSIIGNIVTAPFNDFLSQKVEVKAFGENFDEKLTLKSIIANIIYVAGNLIKLLLLMAAAHILIFLFNFIPLFGNILYTVLGFLITAFFFGFQFYDYPFERRRYTFGKKLKTAFRFIPQVLGVGVGFFLLSLIPVINFLGLNMATIAATVMFSNCIKPV